MHTVIVPSDIAIIVSVSCEAVFLVTKFTSKIPVMVNVVPGSYISKNASRNTEKISESNFAEERS